MRLPVLLAVLLAAHAAAAQSPPRLAESEDLVVAVSEAAPLSSQSADGTWDGLGVAFAQQVGQGLGRGVRFLSVAPDSALAAVADGRADVAVVSTSVEGEAVVDYTVPFLGARLAVAQKSESGPLAVAGRFFSPTFFKIAAGLALLLLLIGVAMWAAERKAEGDDFREDRAGIWDGFWWAGVTMTTIGYGDTVPETVPGRSMALLWMLVSMALTAALTTALVSALGVGSGSGSGSGSLQLPDDLQDRRIGVVDGSAAAGVLRDLAVQAQPYPTVAAGLAAVEADSLDAFADALPRLRTTRSSDSDLEIVSSEVTFDRWALAVAEGSDLREPLGRAVLDRLHSADWPETVRRYTE